MEHWNDFFVAEVGASAALAGLIFVAVSINLTHVLSIPSVANRALESLLMLFAVLVVSLLLLVPGQGTRLLGGELLGFGIFTWAAMTLVDVHSLRHTRREFMKHVYLSVVIDQVTMLFYLAGAIAVLSQGERGIYWLVPATLCSFIKGFLDAWVILVEINR